MSKYFYQVSVLTKGLNPQGFLGIQHYQCASLKAVGCLKSILKSHYCDAKFRVYKILLYNISDLKDNKIPQSNIVLIHDGF